jgi:hypothetical protein
MSHLAVLHILAPLRMNNSYVVQAGRLLPRLADESTMGLQSKGEPHDRTA